MQGDKKVIEVLNVLAASEQAAVLQYIVESQIVNNWGYSKLAEEYMKRARDEMRHLDLLNEKILFLEGMPTVSPSKVFVGAEVPDQLVNDHLAEATAITNYNEAIDICTEAKDSATKELLEDILVEETEHINKIEENQDQIKQMGLAIFLSTKV